jgi:hypothetical protein
MKKLFTKEQEINQVKEEIKTYHRNILLHALNNIDKSVISADIKLTMNWFNFYADFLEVTYFIFEDEHQCNCTKNKYIQFDAEL